MPRRRTDFRGLLESNRVRLLGAIQAEGGRTLKQLCDETGIPINTARDHLWALQEQGLVAAERAETGRPGRPPLVYHPADREHMSDAAWERLERARERRRHLQEILGGRGGEEPAADQLEVLFEHLEDVGVSPAATSDGLQIELCPARHRALYEEWGTSLCEMHGRLIEDTLAQVEGPLTVARIMPFVDSDTCRVILQIGENVPDEIVTKDADE